MALEEMMLEILMSEIKKMMALDGNDGFRGNDVR